MPDLEHQHGEDELRSAVARCGADGVDVEVRAHGVPGSLRYSSTATSSWARSQPDDACRKNPIFGLSMAKVGRRSRAASLEDVLGGVPSELESCGDGCCPFDEVVVEEWDADFEGVGHAGAVEVVEHVVGQRELRIEVQRGCERVVVRHTEPDAVDRTGRRGRCVEQPAAEHASDRGRH